MTLLDRARADLRLVATWWEGLAELRDPSVYAPAPPSALTDEQRAERDHQARLERVERDGIMPGEHQDAARAGVLDLLAQLAYDADEIAETVALGAGVDRPPVLPSAFSDPAPLLNFAASHLDALDLDAGRWVAAEARRMIAVLSRALCLTYDGQALQAVCPWCQGRTETAPVGGAKTWRVRDLLGRKDCDHGQADRAACRRCDHHIAIVCESGTCEPPSRDVGTWVRGMPAWPISEWDWLARQVQVIEAMSKIPTQHGKASA